MFNPKIKSLAIVIPAYKRLFFKETLTSVFNQSNKNFTLYVGDDCSPDNLPEVLNSFNSNDTVVYKRFDNNLGGKDLVAHWQRCIDMVNDEEWIWLFSDDDIMECDCVEKFYQELHYGVPSNLYHFNVSRIDRLSNIVIIENDYETHLAGIDFINKLINFRIRSYVVEYIFNVAHFKKSGGFEKFDLAWGSDHATWLKLSIGGTITTISGPRVQWRKSGYNITSIDDNQILSERKRNAELCFYKWLVDFFREKLVPLPFSNFSAIRWFLQGVIIYTQHYGFRKVPEWINKFTIISGGTVDKFQCYLGLLFYTILSFLKRNLRSQGKQPLYI